MKNSKIKIPLLIIAGLAVVVVIAAIIFAAAFDANRYKPRIEAAAFDATGMTLRIGGDISLALFPSVGVSIEDILLTNKGSSVASVKEVDVKMELLPLLRKEIRVSRVGIISPEFLIVKDDKGRFNFEASRKKPVDKAESSMSTQVGKIYVKNARLKYLDEKTRATGEANGCELTIEDLVMAAKEAATAASFDGDLSCDEVKSKGIDLSDLSVRVKARGGNFELSPVKMKIFGGAGSGSVEANGMAPGRNPEYKADFAIKKFSAEKAFAALSEKKSLSGELDADVRLVVKGRSAKEMTRSAVGEVSLRGEELVYEGMDIDGVLGKYEKTQRVGLLDVGAFFIAGPFGPMLTRGYNYGGAYAASRGGKSEMRKLVSVWKIKNGVAQAEDVAFSTKENRVAVKGRLDVANELLDDVTVAVLDEKGCAKFEQKINGTFRNPRMEKVSTIKSLAGPVAGLFEKTKNLFNGNKCEVFYDGSVKHPG